MSPILLREHFYNVFIVDALLGNFDRHNGNWGFLYDEKTGMSEIAPVFDCGSCLLPQADEKIMKMVISDEKERNARVFQFPTSAIKQSGHKINYYDFLMDAHDGDCNAALGRIVPNMDMQKIRDFIDKTEGITDLQKTFYKCYIDARYELIIRPAYEKVIAVM